MRSFNWTDNTEVDGNYLVFFFCLFEGSKYFTINFKIKFYIATM